MDTPEKELLTPEETPEDFESVYASLLEEFGEQPEAEGEEAPEQQSEAPDPDRNAYADKQVPPAKKDNSIRNLTVLIILELLAIAGVIGWWISRLL